MAHSLSAKKRVRQSLKRHARNRARKDQIKAQLKTFNTVLATGTADEAEVELRKVVQRLDRVASKHTIHKNTAARKRSRLTLKLNAVRAGTLKPTVPGGKPARKEKAGAGTGGAKA